MTPNPVRNNPLQAANAVPVTERISNGVKFFDAHTHTQFAAYDEDREFVIERALAVGVEMINVGTQKDTSLKAVELASKYENGVYAAVGLHPIHTEKSFHDEKELGLPAQAGGDGAAKEFTSRGEEFDYDYYKNLALNEKVVAIGECGLDYYRLTEATKEKQKENFLKQIELAKEVKKPLMIHCRNAFADLIKILAPNAYGLAPSIVHFFSGSKDDARELLDLGFSFTFGGVITFARPARIATPARNAVSTAGWQSVAGGDYDEVIKFIPADRILSETDAPYVAPAPYRGKRNEPAYVIEVVKKLAEIKGIEFEKAREQILENAKRIFKINPKN